MKLAVMVSLMALAFMTPGVAAQQGTSRVDQKALKALQGCCSSATPKSRTCSWADDKEQDLYNSCILCGTIWSGTSTSNPPITLTRPNGTYYQYAAKIPSLACKGPSVVRAVFKQQRQDWKQPGCADTRLENIGLPGASPVVRCELVLPAGAASEMERALRSKETNCRICNMCSEGGGCPNVPGKWYSDSYTINLPGCSAPAADLASAWQRRAGIVLNAGTNILLAKFEVCNSPSCYNAAYEAAKLKSARKCVKGKC